MSESAVPSSNLLACVSKREKCTSLGRLKNLRIHYRVEHDECFAAIRTAVLYRYLMQAGCERGVKVDTDVVLVSRRSWGGIDECADYVAVDMEGHIGIAVWGFCGESEGAEDVY